MMKLKFYRDSGQQIMGWDATGDRAEIKLYMDFKQF